MKMLKQTPKIVALLMGSLMLLSSCSEDDDVATEPEAEILPPIVLDCDYFKEDRILENDPQRPIDYIVTCWARVQGSLKIEAGVVIEFENHAGLRVDLDNNVFEIKGTSSEPVILSGTSKQKGYWRGIFLSEAHNPNNLIEHTVIEYAGSQNLTGSSPVYEGSLAIRGSSGTTPQALTLNHVEISNGGSVGIDYHRVTKQNSVATSNLIITGNEDVPVKVSAEMAHIFDSSSSYSGNASDFLNITTSSYEIEDQTVTWEKLDVPYLVDGRVSIGDDGHLTIEAGVEMEFKSGAYLQPYGFLPPYNLSLKIMGTAADPVHLRAHNDINWGGIQYGFTQEDNIINYAIIENAKGDFPVGNHQNTGAIYMHASPKLRVSNTTFKDLQNCAFYSPYGADYFDNLEVTNVTFDNVAGGEYCDND
ncbi:hypothetical protein GGR32_000654 [Mesonia hippocampi]|uniref:Right-handed parallel beta-helix repeat-containing protein n=1 Tax=Mesonia hippocampi TaxID=1628250 RepID=A0A840EN38_9FLAO|nr:hypothetical protein [Mesonia hippocampi]MBB4118380.1 hypothetical protein [Mesonia hippocampi]